MVSWILLWGTPGLIILYLYFSTHHLFSSLILPFLSVSVSFFRSVIPLLFPLSPLFSIPIYLNIQKILRNNCVHIFGSNNRIWRNNMVQISEKQFVFGNAEFGSRASLPKVQLIFHAHFTYALTHSKIMLIIHSYIVVQFGCCLGYHWNQLDIVQHIWTNSDIHRRTRLGCPSETINVSMVSKLNSSFRRNYMFIWVRSFNQRRLLGDTNSKPMIINVDPYKKFRLGIKNGNL